ncbi:hypothetical protein [Paenibacillus tengchongensis]|uniref:hypothetical protein n=1 Tax=Paenibacillus tengchongensis TaxID=2608684 RepID=UPI00124E6096|nr:hypothetical protein [Paenibacillus tengchongensis]
MSEHIANVYFRWVKPLLEHEEGMNHLWVQVPPMAGIKAAWLQLQLPAGIYAGDGDDAGRMDSSGRRILPYPDSSSELLFAVYTEHPIACGITAVILRLDTEDAAGNLSSESWTVPLRIVDAAEAEQLELELDEELVTKIKERAAGRDQETQEDERELLDCTPAKIIRFEAGHRSALEKELWIEG